MIRTLAALVVVLWLAGYAAGPPPGQPPEVAQAYADLEGPAPANLVRVSQGDLIGRPIQSTGATLHTIHYVLADAKTGEQRYVLASGGDAGSYLMIPMSVLRVSPGGVVTGASPEFLGSFPQMSQLYMEHRFRPAQ